LVDDGVDTGPIVLQEAVPVLEGDDEESLARRILEAEHRVYPAALAHLAAGRVHVAGRVTRIHDNGA
jgi:phosphoribosylglycinamide formyltransferase-1